MFLVVYLIFLLGYNAIFIYEIMKVLVSYHFTELITKYCEHYEQIWSSLDVRLNGDKLNSSVIISPGRYNDLAGVLVAASDVH